jgi:hypothetical protein
MSVRASRLVRRYGLPSYPTKLAALADPGLLRRHVPRGWLSQREIAALAGVLLAADAAGCRQTTPPVPRTTLAPDAAAVVAPIFAHGDGRGAAGCVVVTPPALLAEEEALQVIGDELSRHGLQLTQRNVTLPAVTVTMRAPWDAVDWVSGRRKIGYREWAAAFELDGLDLEHEVGVEFASAEDFYRLAGPWNKDEGWSSATDFDFQQVARFIGNAVGGKPGCAYLGVFYDPATAFDLSFRTLDTKPGQSQGEQRRAIDEWERRIHEAERAAKLESKRLLREQVKDFVDWLKAQGVI